MINSLKYKTFFKFLGLIMRFKAKVHPSALQSLHLNWRLSNWSCSPTFIDSRTLHSLTLEERDLITGVLIDICAHIFQTIGKTTTRMVARTCIPFCSLLMKIMVLEGVRPLTDGKILPRLQPLSMISLQASKSHSSKALESEFFPHATPPGHSSATPMHIETASPIPPELQMTSTQ